MLGSCRCGAIRYEIDGLAGSHRGGSASASRSVAAAASHVQFSRASCWSCSTAGTFFRRRGMGGRFRRYGEPGNPVKAAPTSPISVDNQ
jgi:hypothetical protein